MERPVAGDWQRRSGCRVPRLDKPAASHPQRRSRAPETEDLRPRREIDVALGEERRGCDSIVYAAIEDSDGGFTRKRFREAAAERLPPRLGERWVGPDGSEAWAAALEAG